MSPVEPAAEFEQLLGAISSRRNCDFYFFAGTIGEPEAARFHNCVCENAHMPNAVLLLTTLGGSGDAAYQMARALQNRYNEGSVSILVTTFCKSAGTLLALGAKNLIMADLAQLGPLDVQIAKPDTLGERTSGLTPSQALMTLRDETFKCFERFFIQILERSSFTITTRTAAIIAANVTAGLFRPIFGQIDPMRLGEFQRAIQIAMEYGRRLDCWSNNLKDRALAKLLSGYPSHEFVIDRTEAKTLFHHVEEATDEEVRLSELVAPDALTSAGGRNADIRYFGPKKQGSKDGVRPAANPQGTGTRPSRGRTRSPGNGRRDRRGTEGLEPAETEVV